jgi:hypothetical protein
MTSGCSDIDTEAGFGGSVASVIWGEQPAIDTTTRMDILRMTLDISVKEEDRL